MTNNTHADALRAEERELLAEIEYRQLEAFEAAQIALNARALVETMTARLVHVQRLLSHEQTN